MTEVTYPAAVYQALLAERDALRAALNEALAQNERFDKRYRDAEAENERLRAAIDQTWRPEVTALRARIETLEKPNC